MNWPQAASEIESTLGLVALYDFTERERRRLVERTEAAEHEHGLQGLGGHEKLGVVRKWGAE